MFSNNSEQGSNVNHRSSLNHEKTHNKNGKCFMVAKLPAILSLSSCRLWLML